MITYPKIYKLLIYVNFIMDLGKDYKLFSGDARTSIPKMKEEGYKIQSVADVMQNRLSYGREFSDWKDNFFDTSDGTVYNTRGDVKIVLDADYIRNIDPSTKLNEGAVVLDNGTFESLNDKSKVLYLPKGEVKNLHNKPYTVESVKDSEVWNFLARDNKLLSDYTDEFFPEMKKRFGIKKAMEIYFDSKSNFEKGRALGLGRLGGRSNAGARNNLGYGGDRFVGSSGGAAGKDKKDLEDKLGKDILSAINSGIAFEHNGILYVPTNAKNIKLKK